ncbi:MAG: ABC transporter ATP-binding protein [Bdellovibrionaceae bacterium]|nr:ABC transporter ATP-binding protein [Pseudobdellovibrionaceae bacterium]|tara:strand:+ start:15017 stop:15763 length:747 start_codon:yes stop_codon:yes gene_type:complete
MIQFKNVVKRFGERTILKGISFEVKKGEILFILGTSGTGKSVSLKSLVGLLRPEEGEIYIDDQRVDQLTEEEYLPIRKKCGMVFQHPALFDSLSIYENIAFGLRRHYDLPEKEVKERVLRCSGLVNINAELLELLPQSISYGMQKRVSLARTLAVEPEILLFDEPTTGLDPITTNTVNELIFDLSRELKTTSLVVSHDMGCALNIADRIIVLDQGNVVDQGTPEQLRKSQVALTKDFLAEVLENESVN